MPVRGRDDVDVALVDDAAVRMQEVEGDRAAAALPRRRPVHARGRAAVRVPQPLQRLEHPRAEALDPPRDRVDADPLDVAQADLDRRDAEVVDGAVLEQRVAGERHDHVALDVRGDHRAAAEPGALQPLERRAPREQRAEPGRVAEHLVEGDRDEVRLPHRQVEPARRHERGGVQDHVPAALLGRRDPLERVLDAGEVGLRRVGEEVVAVRGARRRGSARAPRRRRGDRAPRAARTRSARPWRRANSRMPLTELWLSNVARKRALGLNGYASPTSRRAPVAFGREDAGVLALGGVEVAQHGGARPLHEHGRGRRGGIDRVRVAEDGLAQQAQVLVELRLRVQAAAGVVEVDVAARVEAPVLGCAQLVERRPSRGRRGSRRGTRPPPRLAGRLEGIPRCGDHLGDRRRHRTILCACAVGRQRGDKLAVPARGQCG